MKTHAKPKLTTFSVAAVAEAIGVNDDKVRLWIRTGQLKAINISNQTRPRWRISQASLDAFIELRSNKAANNSNRRNRQSSDVTE